LEGTSTTTTTTNTPGAGSADATNPVTDSVVVPTTSLDQPC
jgi:hypothetical protein